MPKKTKLRGQADRETTAPVVPVDTTLFAPGERVCVGVSGGADSTALLRILFALRDQLGIVLSVLHVEHGLRGEASVDDAEFVRTLAEQLKLPCEVVRVDTPQRMSAYKESTETAARALRYQAFRDVLAADKADKVATAHTLDDQAETVLMKLLRGAWTEGLSGIHPELRMEIPKPRGGQSGDVGSKLCVRPFLKVQRVEIEGYLREIGQPWRQDASNESLEHTRNRIRHDLLPKLREYNPQIGSILAHMAENARAEEQHWQAELDRLLPLLLLPGKPTRGGGRSVATANDSGEVSIDIERLREFDPALRRRVLRAAGERLAASLDFEATERLLTLASSRPHVPGRRSRLELAGGVSVERSARELRFSRSSSINIPEASAYELPIPGTIEAPAFHSRFTATWPGEGSLPNAPMSIPAAQVRVWKPGDRVQLQHSSGPKKVKEILNRMKLSAEDRAAWPVVSWCGTIIWMRGVNLANLQNLDQSRGISPEGCPSSPYISETPLES
jgi:tRNA(Ile)-lysidine synthase